MVKYHTSLRARSIEETLNIVRTYAKMYGITRVTDTTRLDNIGIPVFASIRPNAAIGSLCVSAGKGVHPKEAEVGAYMEALELAICEPQLQKIPIVKATYQDVLDGPCRSDAVLDFCPRLNTSINLDQEVDCVVATDIATGKPFLVPAELAYIPYNVGPPVFGSNSNGLSGGNSLADASVHGLLEVIERDITSFQHVNEQTALVHPNSYPPSLQQIKQLVEEAGHELVIKYGFNEFNLPFFIASVIDGFKKEPLYINGGYGCHFDKEISILRAATEALQSRLIFIHGGRDDLIKTYKKYVPYSFEQRATLFDELKAYLYDSSETINFQDIEEMDWKCTDLESYLEMLVNFLKDLGFPLVLRLAYTQPDEPIQIVKIIVPKMEMFAKDTLKVGKRLRDYVSNIANDPIRRSVFNGTI